MRTAKLSDAFVYKVVNRYIGVSGGYLGDFTKRTHREFYVEYCEVGVNPDEFEGTTRERFVEILSKSEPRVQAKILLGVVQRFPVGQPNATLTRTADLREQIETTARELERGSEPTFDAPACTAEVVQRAIRDAEILLKANGPTSAVDRVHTALHGLLIRVCHDAGIGVPDDPGLPLLFKAIRDRHPAFRDAGPRSQDVAQIMRAAGSILDVMSPIRNRASMAHPNEELLGPEEAMFVVNVARSILIYLEAKLPASATD